MAMDKDGMAAKVMEVLSTEDKISQLTAAQKETVRANMTLICDAIIQYLKSNAEVYNVSSDVTVTEGVTSCATGAGSITSGSGTATQTGSGKIK